MMRRYVKYLQNVPNRAQDWTAAAPNSAGAHERIYYSRTRWFSLRQFRRSAPVMAIFVSRASADTIPSDLDFGRLCCSALKAQRPFSSTTMTSPSISVSGGSFSQARAIWGNRPVNPLPQRDLRTRQILRASFSFRCFCSVAINEDPEDDLRLAMNATAYLPIEKTYKETGRTVPLQGSAGEMKKPAGERRDRDAVINEVMDDWLFQTPVPERSELAKRRRPENKARGGTQIDPSNLRKLFNRLLADAKLRQVRFHDLRHSFASMLLQNRESLTYVKEPMGHSRSM